MKLHEKIDAIHKRYPQNLVFCKKPIYSENFRVVVKHPGFEDLEYVLGVGQTIEKAWEAAYDYLTRDFRYWRTDRKYKLSQGFWGDKEFTKIPTPIKQEVLLEDVIKIAWNTINAAPNNRDCTVALEIVEKLEDLRR